jgi:predicted O-linked N-acetylglucosamine transferase (SPINDLY family)
MLLAVLQGLLCLLTFTRCFFVWAIPSVFVTFIVIQPLVQHRNAYFACAQFGGYNAISLQEYSDEEREIVDDGWSNYVMAKRPHSSSDKEGVDEEYQIPIQPEGRIAWVNDRRRARILAREGNFYEAKQQYLLVLRKYSGLRSRSVHDIQLELGQLLVIIGDPGEALQSFKEALSFQPHSHLAHYHLGMLSTRIGSFVEAIDHYKNALYYNPLHCQTLHNLGSLLMMLLRFEEAEYYFETSHTKKACGPEDVLHREFPPSMNDGSQAVSDSETIKDFNGSKPSLEFLTQNIIDHFLGAFVAQVQKLNPKTESYLDIYYNQLNEQERTLVTVNILIHAGEAMYRQGLVEEAANLWRGALDMHTDKSGLHLLSSLAVPLYLSSTRQSFDVFEDVSAGIKTILESFTDNRAIYVAYPEVRMQMSNILVALELHFASTSVAPTRWYVDNERAVGTHGRAGQYVYLATQIAHIISKSTPSLNHVAPWLNDWHSQKSIKRRRGAVMYIRKLRREAKSTIALPPPRLKIAFVSSRFHGNSTESQMLHGFISRSSAAKSNGFFHVSLWVLGYQQEWESDTTFSELCRRSDDVAFLSNQLREAQNFLSLKTNAVDVLVFIAPTLDDPVYWLSHGRYAPVQIAHGAGGGTSGLTASIDYVLGSDIMTHGNAQFTYSEQLIRFRGIGLALPPPLLPQIPESARPGYPKQYKYLNGALFMFANNYYYFVPHSIMGILHPIFDKVLCKIIMRNPRAIVLFAAPRGSNIAYERLITRVRKGLEDSKDQARLRFLPALSRHEYLSLMAAVDVVLDPYPASGTGNVYLPSIEALALGTPVLTLHDDKERKNKPRPSQYPVAAILKSFGEKGEAFVTKSIEEYIETAVSLPQWYANNENAHAFKEYLRRKTRDIYVGETLYSDWVVFLKRVARMTALKDDNDHELKSHPTLPEERVAVIEELIQGGSKRKIKRKHRKRQQK